MVHFIKQVVTGQANALFLLRHLSEKLPSPYAPFSGPFVRRKGQRDVWFAFGLPVASHHGLWLLQAPILYRILASVQLMILDSIQNCGSHYDIIIQVCHCTLFICDGYHFFPLDFFLTSNSLLSAFMPCPPNSPTLSHPRLSAPTYLHHTTPYISAQPHSPTQLNLDSVLEVNVPCFVFLLSPLCSLVSHSL